jgi:hypothetical protein
MCLRVHARCAAGALASQLLPAVGGHVSSCGCACAGEGRRPRCAPTLCTRTTASPVQSELRRTGAGLHGRVGYKCARSSADAQRRACMQGLEVPLVERPLTA